MPPFFVGFRVGRGNAPVLTLPDGSLRELLGLSLQGLLGLSLRGVGVGTGALPLSVIDVFVFFFGLFLWVGDCFYGNYWDD
jgi:hypothetical protein